jgi:hypothetical protein
MPKIWIAYTSLFPSAIIMCSAYRDSYVSNVSNRRALDPCDSVRLFSGPASGNGDFVQLSAQCCSPTLTVDVGQRHTLSAGTLLNFWRASAVLRPIHTLSPKPGVFLLSTVEYNSGKLGQALTIRLTGDGRGQADVGSVSLDAATTNRTPAGVRICADGQEKCYKWALGPIVTGHVCYHCKLPTN